ncbi:hypothetical protein H0H81_012636 [Sphagnurus paluster]|uniref:F-box domain-containing protein n=1 Tax=Sphagnurus paluster TaxID=117069 RepID=A0A9P7GIG9_9AGAR|nr:hypothetical protein H0H81_012636 [Sphagnurus paluster]
MEVDIAHIVEFQAGTSNSYILTLAQEKLAKQVISKLRAELYSSDLDAPEMNSLRREEHLRLNRFLVAASPLKRVPPEILSHIFLYTVPDFGIRFPREYHDGQFPFELRNVCSHWRKISEYTPALWNSVEIGHIDPETSISLSDTLGSARSTIRDNFPLSISIAARDEISAIMALGELVVPNLYRLKHLRLDIPISSLCDLIKNHRNELPSLVSLDLAITSSPDDFALLPHLTAFKEAPNLRRMAIRADPYSSRSFLAALLDIFIPSDKIKELDISDFGDCQDLEMVEHVLQKCPNLETFYASITEPEFQSSISILDSDKSVNLSSLRTLCLSKSRYVHSTAATKMHIPWWQLQELSIGTMPLEQLSTILCQCTRVQRLAINSTYTLEDADIIYAYTTTRTDDILLPHLTSLKSSSAQNILFDRLVLPALLSLNFGIHNIKLATPVILAATRLIRRSRCTLQSLQINCTSKMPPDYHKVLHELLAQAPEVAHFTYKFYKAPLREDMLEDILARTLLPRLLSLRCRGSSQEGGRILRMIEQRMKRDNERAGRIAGWGGVQRNQWAAESGDGTFRWIR